MIDRAIRAHHRPSILLAVVVLAVALPLAGCGSSGGGSSSSASTQKPPTSTPSGTSTVAAAPSCGSSVPSTGASEVASTAQGDIPDNQQFLSFKNRGGGYAISYPEGWARSGSGSDVNFRNLSNSIAIKVTPGSRPTTASVTSELKQEAAADPCLKAGTPQTTSAGPNQVVKVTYTTEGQKSQVTGKRLRITVDRYVYFKGGKVATLDLGTPVGVDNVDAYRMISESFRWS